MTVHPPAKINLSLRITGKRPDGFHGLETLILPLPSLHDDLTFTPAENFSLHCETAGVPTDETNLVSRALRLFEKESGHDCPYRINLTKRIPHGAGLGGGSADAAHTFLALNDLTGTHVPVDQLAQWAATLGSDIPVFLSQSPSWCTGRGELIKPFDLKWKSPLLLFKPRFDIPTPWAYSKWQHSRELPTVSYQPQNVGDITLFNDLERPVFEKHLFLAELKSYLQAQKETSAALMSGSGSTVFAVLNEKEDAQSLIARTLEEMDPTMWWHLSN